MRPRRPHLQRHSVGGGDGRRYACDGWALGRASTFFAMIQRWKRRGGDGEASADNLAAALLLIGRALLGSLGGGHLSRYSRCSRWSPRRTTCKATMAIRPQIERFSSDLQAMMTSRQPNRTYSVLFGCLGVRRAQIAVLLECLGEQLLSLDVLLRP